LPPHVLALLTPASPRISVQVIALMDFWAELSPLQSSSPTLEVTTENDLLAA